MRKWSQLILTFCLCIGAMPLFAQLANKLETSSKKYLQYEPVYARLTTRNLSAHPLAFSDTGRLRAEYVIIVQDANGRELKFNDKKALPFVPHVLAVNESHQTIIPLTRYFDLRRAGAYRVKIQIRHPQLPQGYESPWAVFTVVKGKTVLSHTLGVYTGRELYEGEKITTRKASILSYFDGSARLYYYCLEDEHQIYSLNRLCREYDSGEKILVANDDQNTTYFLIRVTRKLYLFVAFDTEGRCLKREVYINELNSQRPQLAYESIGSKKITCEFARKALGNEYVDDGYNIAENTSPSTLQPGLNL